MKTKLLTILSLLVMCVTGAWADTVLFTTNFSTTDGWSNESIITSSTTSATRTIKGTTISFAGYKSSDCKISGATSTGGTLTFTGNNISASEGDVAGSNPNYYMAIPVTGVVGGMVTVTFTTSSAYKPYYTYDDGSVGSVVARQQATANNTFTIEGLTSDKVTIYLGTSGKTMTSLTISTPVKADLSTSGFYATNVQSSDAVDAATLIEDAELPPYIAINNCTSADNGSNNTSEVTTPFDFSSIGNSKFYRLKPSTSSNIVVGALSHVKSIRVYGNGSGSTGNIKVAVKKISGTGAAMTVTDKAFANSKSTIVEYSTGDLTAMTGYDADTYYLYTITFTANFSLWGIYVETAITTPALSIAPNEAADFNYVVGNGPSDAQTFTVTGSNLTDDDITVSLQAGDSYYEISDDNTTFVTTALTVASGDEVYVRLKEGLSNNSYAGTLRFASTGADNVDIALSGSVTNQTYTVEYDLNGGDGDAPTEDPQEAGAIITLPAAPTRAFYTFAGWLCSADGLVKTASSSYTMTAANTTFTAQWTNPQYASSLDFTAVTLGGLTGSTDISDFLASANMVASNLGTGSGWDAQTAASKYGFWGYKLKNSGATVKFLVKAGKRVSIILGRVYDNATLKKGDTSSTISANSEETDEAVVPSFVADKDMVVSITTSSNGTVTLKRIFIADEATSVSGTISASGWSTFSSEYPLDLSTISGGAAYYAKSTSGNNVTVTSTTDKVIAGEGLMIQGTPNAEFTINVDAAATAAISDNLLRGVPVGGTVKSADHNYVFAWPSATPENYGFYLVNSTAPVLAAGKSFLHLSADLSNEAAFLSMIFDDEQTTGIESIHNLQFTIHTDAPTYNLSGQRVGESYKGIVIVNGRKFVRK